MSSSRDSVETVSEGGTSKQEENSLDIIQEVYLFHGLCHVLVL